MGCIPSDKGGGGGCEKPLEGNVKGCWHGGGDGLESAKDVCAYLIPRLLSGETFGGGCAGGAEGDADSEEQKHAEDGDALGWGCLAVAGRDKGCKAF